MFKAVLTQDAAQGEIGVRLRVIVREDGSLASHFRHGLELEAVAGKVRRLKRKALRERVEEHILRLTGQTVHQIQTDVGKAVLVCEQNGVLALQSRGCARCGAARYHARPARRRKAGLHRRRSASSERCVRALRVAFDRYFRVFCQSKAHGPREGCVRDAAAQIRRRAAAEVDRVGRAACAFSPYSRMERMRASV